MRLLKTLILAVLFVLLAAYVFFIELKKPEQKSEHLLNFQEEDVQGMILNYPDLEIRLRREPLGRWKITQPLEANADEAAVGSILGVLGSSRVSRTLEGKPTAADLKNYGLDNPQVRVLLSLRNGVALPPLFVGGKTPIGDSAYVRRGAESAVLLTDASLRAALEKKLKDFRDKRILEFTEQAVQQLALRGAKGDFDLSKKGEEWYIDSPKSYRADQPEVRGLLSVVHDLSALDFIEDSAAELKKYGLDKPRLKVALYMGKQEGSRELLFGNKREGRDDVYVVSNPKGAVYTVSEGAVEQLEKDLTALRDKQILSLRPEQVARLQITSARESLVLIRGDKGEWSMEMPKKGAVKPAVVSDYLALLSRLRAKGFADDQAEYLKKYGLDTPTLKVAAFDRNGKSLGGLLVGGKSESGYYAAREGERTVYTIDEFSYRLLNRESQDFFPPSHP